MIEMFQFPVHGELLTRNLNPIKSRFCCDAQMRDLLIPFVHVIAPRMVKKLSRRAKAFRRAGLRMEYTRFPVEFVCIKRRVGEDQEQQLPRLQNRLHISPDIVRKVEESGIRGGLSTAGKRDCTVLRNILGYRDLRLG